jgi:hypothetical protein
MAAIVMTNSRPGMVQEDEMHIFHAFFSTKDGGMGMGLTIYAAPLSRLTTGTSRWGATQIWVSARLSTVLVFGTLTGAGQRPNKRHAYRGAVGGKVQWTSAVCADTVIFKPYKPGYTPIDA